MSNTITIMQVYTNNMNRLVRKSTTTTTTAKNISALKHG